MNSTQDSCEERIVGTLYKLRNSCEEPYFTHFNNSTSNVSLSVFRSSFTSLKYHGATITNCRPFGYSK